MSKEQDEAEKPIPNSYLAYQVKQVETRMSALSEQIADLRTTIERLERDRQTTLEVVKLLGGETEFHLPPPITLVMPDIGCGQVSRNDGIKMGCPGCRSCC